jgi:hypothetical protein
MVLQALQLHQPKHPSTSERACIVGTTQTQPLPTTRPPTTLLQLTNARHRKGVDTAELILSNRGRLPTSAASAHFSLFSMASERRSKERRHAMEVLTRRCQGYHCKWSANYGSDTALVNTTCGVASIGDRLTCSSIAASLLTDRVLALDTTGW